jgi:hypothetical protein
LQCISFELDGLGQEGCRRIVQLPLYLCLFGSLKIGKRYEVENGVELEVEAMGDLELLLPSYVSLQGASGRKHKEDLS